MDGEASTSSDESENTAGSGSEIRDEEHDEPVEQVQHQKLQQVLYQQVLNQQVLNSQDDRFYSPLVRKIAAEEKISQEELDSIPGSGLNGRVQKKDILTFS